MRYNFSNITPPINTPASINIYIGHKKIFSVANFPGELEETKSIENFRVRTMGDSYRFNRQEVLSAALLELVFEAYISDGTEVIAFYYNNDDNTNPFQIFIEEFVLDMYGIREKLYDIIRDYDVSNYIMYNINSNDYSEYRFAIEFTKRFIILQLFNYLKSLDDKINFDIAFYYNVPKDDEYYEESEYTS